MPESLIETRRRIQTIQSTEKITKAMKLVASVKYQRWKKMVDSALPYQKEIESVLNEALSFVSKDNKNPLFNKVESDKTLYLIVTSSLGLCGSYNYNLYRTIDPLLKKEDEILVIGEKGFSHYSGKENKVYDDYVSLYSDYNYDQVRKLREYLVSCYKTGNYGSIKLVYTKYKNSMTFIPTVKPIFPLEITEKETEEKPFEPIYEPDRETVINKLIPLYLDSLLHLLLVESGLSEQASRRNAMETATDNADDMLGELKIAYNKARQNAITQEITEVVAGANAGKSE